MKYIQAKSLILPRKLREELGSKDKSNHMNTKKDGRGASKTHRPEHSSYRGGVRNSSTRLRTSDSLPRSQRSSLNSEDGAVIEEHRPLDIDSNLLKMSGIGNAKFRQSIAEDDVRIASLERKLGKRRKKASGLENLLGELDELGGHTTSDEDAENFSLKRSHDPVSEEWLSKKRLKFSEDANDHAQRSAIPDEILFDGTNRLFEEAKFYNKQRENPYKAPYAAAPTHSLLKTNTLKPEIRDFQPLRRQMQGLFNRLSEKNFLDITRRVDELYRENPRNDVSTVITDLMITHLTGQGSLNDTFIILHSGFAAALYKVVGTDFGAHLIQALVNTLQERKNGDDLIKGGEESNIISFLAELYCFQVIGSRLIYDFIREFIEDLSELSVELLLRIVRSSGQQLRQDDPSSLTDIVALLQNAVKGIGELNMSVRARFMVETITNLKSGRVKTGHHAVALRTEHTVVMKRILASMGLSKNITIKAVEPLCIGLDDIRNSQLRGKWWLIGASFKDEVLSEHKNESLSETTAMNYHHSNFSPNDDITNDITDERQRILPDVSAAAKSLGMNTAIRKAIFTAIVTAAGVNAAYTSITKLCLSKRQKAEIAVVLTRCSASQYQYNEFYHALAQRLSIQREIRKTLWNPLIEVITVLEEEEHITKDRVTHHEWCRDAQARFNVSRFYSFLIADNVVSLSVLKSRDILGAKEKLTSFYELLLVNLLSILGTDSKKISRCFEALRGSEIAGQMEIFLEKVVKQSSFIDPKQTQSIRQSCTKAIKVIRT